MESGQEEVLVKLRETDNNDILRRHLEVLPDTELDGVSELVKKAEKRRKIRNEFEKDYVKDDNEKRRKLNEVDEPTTEGMSVPGKFKPVPAKPVPVPVKPVPVPVKPVPVPWKPVPVPGKPVPVPDKPVSVPGKPVPVPGKPVPVPGKPVPVLGKPVPGKPLSVPASVEEGGWYSRYGTYQIISLDVEKVEMYPDKYKTSKKYIHKAGSVAVVDFNGKLIYNALIRREKGSYRYNPNSKNGFTVTSLQCKSAQAIEVVQKKLKELFAGKLIIGCAMANDFDSLDIPFSDYSDNCFDLQWHFFSTKSSTRGKTIIERFSLKNMCKRYLNKDIHHEGNNHEAAMDAIYTMAVFRDVYLKLKPNPSNKISTIPCE